MYTDEYLKRLWTVYDLASFLLIKLKVRRVDIIPTFYAQFILGCCFAYWVLLALYDAAYSNENLDGTVAMVLTIAFWIFLAPVYIAVREWRKINYRLVKSLDNFEMGNLECFHQADRKLVENNIETLLRWRCEDSGLPPKASHDDIMEAWNRLVKIWIPDLWEDKFGKIGIPYDHLLAFALVSRAYAVDQIGGMFFNLDVSWWQIFVVIVGNMGQTFVVTPNCTGIGFWIMGLKLDLEGFQSCFLVLLLCLLAVFVPGLVSFIHSSLLNVALASVPGFCVFVAYLGINGIVTCSLFMSKNWKNKILISISSNFYKIVNLN